MFLKILTKWPFQAAKKNYVREIKFEITVTPLM